jgi:hypothetical protein
MSNVHSLWGQPTGERDVQPTLVAALEKMLEQARSGEIVGAALVKLHCDGLASWDVAGKVGGYSLIGATTCAQNCLMEMARDG